MIPRYGIREPSVLRLVREAFPQVDDADAQSLVKAVYLFSLGMLTGKEYSTRLRNFGAKLAVEPTERTELMREFRARTVYSYYIMSDFWRAMLLYVDGGFTYQDIVEVYKVHRGDLEACLQLLTREEKATLRAMAQTRSTYRIDREDYDWLVRKATTIARNVAHRKLRFISKYDAAFDGASELVCEAIRIINHYSYHPSRDRILGAVNLSLPREAERLREEAMAEKRRVIRKLPAFRCPVCHATWEHERCAQAKHRTRGLVNLREALGRSIYVPSECISDTESYFCVACSSKQATLVERVENDREYQTTLVSYDAPVSTPDGGEEILLDQPDDEALMGDEESVRRQFRKTLASKVSADNQRFLNVYLEGDDGFQSWLASRGIKGVTNEQTHAALVCRYLRLDWEKVQQELGAMLGRPRPYLVVTGEGNEAERDIVFAVNARDAVQLLAESYRYKNGKRMQRDCGRIRVREYVEMGTPQFDVERGQIIAMQD